MTETNQSNRPAPVTGETEMTAMSWPVASCGTVEQLFTKRGVTRMASIGRKLSAVGTLLGAIGLVRIQVLMRRAHAAHPREMVDLFARLGYSQKSVQPSLMIAAYQYAVLRRPFLEVSGTSLERERRALLLWFALMFAGVALGFAGIVMEMLEVTAI